VALSLAWLGLMPSLAGASFGPPVTLPDTSQPYALVTGDFTGDGRQDIAVANYDGGVSVFPNATASGASSPTFGSATSLTDFNAPISVAAGDFTGDGEQDLAVANASGPSGGASVFLNTTTTGASAPSFSDPFTPTAGNAATAIAVADLTNDGMPDLVVAQQNTPTPASASDVLVLPNTTTQGALSPSFGTPVTLTDADDPVSVAVADLTVNGPPDIVVANADGGVWVFPNTSTQGASTPSFGAAVELADTDSPDSVAVGDFSRDGLPDIVVGNAGGGVWVFPNTSTQVATTPSFGTAVELANTSPADSVAVGDLEGGGLPDIVAADSGGGLSVFLNTTPAAASAPSFGAPLTIADSGAPQSLAVADLNGDGKPDIAVANLDGGVSVYTNTSVPMDNPSPSNVASATAAAPQALGTTSAPQTITITNGGDYVLNVSGVSLAGSDPGDFAIGSDSCAGQTVLPGTQCQINVSFTPSAGGARSARLVVSDTAGGQSISLSGAGPGAPTASVSAPASGGTYEVGQPVATAFSCAEGLAGPGLSTCVDGNGVSASGAGSWSATGALNTSAPGSLRYTVTATSADGQTGASTISYTVLAPPVNLSAPRISGTLQAGARLTCNPAAWTESPTFSFQWNRNGRPIQGATSVTYTIQTVDLGTRLTCTVDATNVAGGSANATSGRVSVPLCPAAGGSVTREGIGPFRLGMTRSQALAADPRVATRGRAYEDYFCLVGGGIRVGYPAPQLLAILPASERGAYRARLIWMSTSNSRYAIHGVRNGTRLEAAAVRLRLEPVIVVGVNDWYLAPNGADTAVLKVRRGIVAEIGIAENAITATRAAQRTFLNSFY
jgi:hypothetical protein